MQKLSLGTAAEQTRSFMRREGALVVPIAFATFGIALILVSLVTPEQRTGEQVQPGLWSLAIFPLMFLALLGQLSISYLVLRPGVTVRDALGAAMMRLPAALVMIVLLVIGIGILGMLLAVLITVVTALLGAGIEAATSTAVVAIMVLMLIIGARLILAWPLIADRKAGAVATLKQAFALSRGHVWKLIALTFAFGFVYMILTGAVQFGLGSVLLILGRLIGAEGAAVFLTTVVVALLGAVIQAVWAVLLTNIYRQLAASPTAVPKSR